MSQLHFGTPFCYRV